MRLLAVLLALLLPLVALPAAAQPLPDIPTLAVPPGAASGRLAAGGRDFYYVRAAALQAMTVSVTSPGNDATFQIYDPNALVGRGGDGGIVITGNPLPDAGPRTDAAAWLGVVPMGGLYLIVVASRGGATSYTLTISLQ